MNEHWRQLAACRDRDPEMWVSPPARSGPQTQPLLDVARQALTICGACPVRTECGVAAGREAVVGMIRAAVVYDGEGRAGRDCAHCDKTIVGRNALAKYCSDKCTSLAAYYAARRERLAA